MKEKIKEYLLVGSIIYGLMIVVFMIISYCDITTTIEFNVSNDFYPELNSYKKEVLNVQNVSCKDELNKFINYIEKHTYDGKVNLNTFYNEVTDSKDSFLNYYGTIKGSCSISEEVAAENNLSSMFLTVSFQNDEIIQRYLYQSEINLKNTLFRMMEMPSMENIENTIKEKNELAIIKTILKIVNGGALNEN